MTEYNISPLTIIRPNTSDDKKPILEILDPANNSIRTLEGEDLSCLANIQKTIDAIKRHSKSQPQKNTHYANWIEKGWHKSLDYYVVSKPGSLKEPTTKLPLSSKECNQATHLPNHLIIDAHTRPHSIPQALLRRRTKRIFRRKPIEKSIFFSALESMLLTNDITGFNLYFVAYNVEDIMPSVYVYDTENKSLLVVRKGQFFNEMSANIQGMRTPQTACFSIILVADFDSLMKNKPFSRGLRDTYIEAGILAQKLVISYMQYGVFSLVTPALRDRDVSALLKLKEPDFSPLYSLTFGYPAK